MAEFNYKIEQLDEEWRIFNDKVIRMNIEYEIKFIVPSWFDLGIVELSENNESFANLEYENDEFVKEGNIRVFSYRTIISSVSKCDLSKDYFDEITGIYICETRAEIKILKKVKKIMTKLYQTIEKKDNKEYIESLIDERLEKNKWNLERLKGNLNN